MNANMITSDRGLQHIMQSEGFRENAYPDPGTGGAPWTIGYGHTGGVKPGDHCTQAQAAAWLRSDVGFAEAVVRLHVKVPLAQSQFDALVSFVYNVGSVAFQQSTLLRKLNAGDYAGAASELDRWVKGGNGQALPGLVTRRREERAMFEEGIASQAVA